MPLSTAQLAALNTSVNKVVSDVAALVVDPAVDPLQPQLDAANAHIADLTAQLNAANAKIANAKTDLA